MNAGGETLLVGAWGSNDSNKIVKYPSARLIMVDRKVHAHNLMSLLDNNWEVETGCDEKILMIIVFPLELKASFFSHLNSREKFLSDGERLQVINMAMFPIST